MLLIEAFHDELGFLEVREPLREDVRRDPLRPGKEFLVALFPQEDVPNDDESPAVPDDVEGCCDGAG